MAREPVGSQCLIVYCLWIPKPMQTLYPKVYTTTCMY